MARKTPKPETPKQAPARAGMQSPKTPTASPAGPALHVAAESTAGLPDAPTAEAGRFCGKKGRSGPPKGNTNNLRHGLRSGSLPKNCKYVEHQMNALRRQLEAAVLEVKGEIGLVDAASIQTAVKWERHGALCLRWLRLEAGSLKPGERLQFSREIAMASRERDKAIQALGIDARPRAPWLELPPPANGNGAAAPETTATEEAPQ